MARERKGQGASWPGSETVRVLLADSLRGANWPGSEKAWYPWNHVLDRDLGTPMQSGNYKGGKGWPIVKYSDSVVSCAKVAEPVEIPFGLWAPVGQRKHVLGGMHTAATW